MIEKINFIDKSFDLNNINHYHLSLQIHLKGFSFCILDRQRNKFIALGNWYFDKITSYSILLNEIQLLFNSEELLKANYQHVKLLFATPKYTYVPAPFFEEANLQNIYSFNHKLKIDEKIHKNYIYGNSSYVLYAIPKFIEEFFLQKFNNLKFYHHSCPLIEELLLKDKLSIQNQKLFVHILPDIVDVVFLKEGKLKLFNSFAYNSDSDFQYFILNVFDQLGLSPVDIPVGILGTITKDNQKIEILKKYLKQLTYLNKPAHFEYAYGFSEVPEHYFINLINLYQCG